ncbi:MAG TPA: hypothetical protein VK914_06300 [bacterium]|nr:hypothetical protein [bacterium]
MRPFFPLFAVCLLAALLGACGRKTGQPSGNAPAGSGIIIVDNSYAATCSDESARAGSFDASLDQGPPVTVADNSKFEFANIAPGSHSLRIQISGPRAKDGAETVECTVSVAAGVSYTERISCDKKGAPSLSCPQS